jgi:hypothetical protein
MTPPRLVADAFGFRRFKRVPGQNKWPAAEYPRGPTCFAASRTHMGIAAVIAERAHIASGTV